MFLHNGCVLCSLTFNFKNRRIKCYLDFTRKYLPQFRVSILWKNYGGRSSLKTQLKIELSLPFTGSGKVLENITVQLVVLLLSYLRSPCFVCFT